VAVHSGFFTLDPCRLLDTRIVGGALPSETTTTIVASNYCGIPPTASALSLNVTVVDPEGAGHLTLFPAGTPLPPTSTLNYRAGRTRANNAILSLSPPGYFDMRSFQPQGTTHVVIDVNGYFQ
jgi:hypothetical protein